jgi:hypothetical protein
VSETSGEYVSFPLLNFFFFTFFFTYFFFFFFFFFFFSSLLLLEEEEKKKTTTSLTLALARLFILISCLLLYSLSQDWILLQELALATRLPGLRREM